MMVRKYYWSTVVGRVASVRVPAEMKSIGKTRLYDTAEEVEQP